MKICLKFLKLRSCFSQEVAEDIKTNVGGFSEPCMSLDLVREERAVISELKRHSCKLIFIEWKTYLSRPTYVIMKVTSSEDCLAECHEIKLPLNRSLTTWAVFFSVTSATFPRVYATVS